MSITLSNTGPTGRHTRMLGVVAAPLAALLVWLAAVPLAGIDLAAQPVPGSAVQPVGPVSVVVSALAAGLVAWAARAMLDRAGTRGRAIWTGIAAVALLVSLAGPLGAGATMAAGIVLASMHVVVGATLIAALAPPATSK